MVKPPLALAFLAALSIGRAHVDAQSATGTPGNRIAPDLLSFEELATLSTTTRPEGALADKMARLLATPFLDNSTSAGAHPHEPWMNGLGPVLRVAYWNIERGRNVDAIRLAFTDAAAFRRIATDARNTSRDSDLNEELRALHDSDVIVLNEVDLGMKRTAYRDIAHDLAAALGMSYAYGTMRTLNESIEGRMSDHAPMTVDLPLYEPEGIGLK